MVVRHREPLGQQCRFAKARWRGNQCDALSWLQAMLQEFQQTQAGRPAGVRVGDMRFSGEKGQEQNLRSVDRCEDQKARDIP